MPKSGADIIPIPDLGNVADPPPKQENTTTIKNDCANRRNSSTTHIIQGLPTVQSACGALHTTIWQMLEGRLQYDPEI